MNKRLIGKAVFLLGLAGALFLIPGTEDKIETAIKVKISSSVVNAITIAGLAMLISGLAIILLDPVIYFIAICRNSDDEILSYDSKIVSRAELKTAHKFCKKHLGNQIASLNTLKRWHRKYPDFAILIIKAKKGKDGIIVTSRCMGFLDFLPLNKKGEDAICRGVSIVALTDEHIESKNIRPACVYVGGIVGTNKISKARVLEAIKTRLEVFKESGVRKFYTKPISRDGLRVAEKYDFVTLDGESCMIDKLALLEV
jgi:hypothetical protein